MYFIKITQEGGTLTFWKADQIKTMKVFEDRVEIYTIETEFMPHTYRGVVSITEPEQIHWQAKKEEPKPEQKEEQPEGEKILWEAKLIADFFVLSLIESKELFLIYKGDTICQTKEEQYVIKDGKVFRFTRPQPKEFLLGHPSFEFTDYGNDKN